MSITWVYRDAPELGLIPWKFGNGRGAESQFKITDVHAWAGPAVPRVERWTLRVSTAIA
ncbi:hypothetical protein ACFC09_15915 [Streptomyces sp. NPDC056161]|uniref:hypothetical protein n=1 Tax=Streptomyces sp. NPDC056161 TaxID=3345732 RepID=UPI0035DBFFE1